MTPVQLAHTNFQNIDATSMLHSVDLDDIDVVASVYGSCWFSL